MLKSFADNEVPNGYASVFANIVYRSNYTVIVTSYNDVNFRSVFCISYQLNEAKYLIKREGTWLQ